MYARYSQHHSSPEFWSTNFRSRLPLQEKLSLLRLKAGHDPRWRAMSAALRPEASVLDVGCGLGAWALFLASRGYETAGVDFSFELLRRARARAGAGVRWAACQAEALPFAPRTFDALISWGVIEHYEAGPAQVLTEFARVLRPGGALFVTVPLDGAKQRHAIEVIDAGKSKETFYEYYFTPEELASHLRSTGFNYVDVRPISKGPNVAAPNAFRWLANQHPLVRDAGLQILKPAMWRSSSFHMLLGVGLKS